MPLPDDVDPHVRTLVEEMTFTSFGDERRHLWQRSNTTKKLKLYDKVSNLLDGTWMTSKRRLRYLKHTRKLMKFVQREYGMLNIVRIAHAICRVER